MSRISYVIKRIGKMDFSRMRDTARMLHKKTGKSTAWLLMDMARCAAKYNAGYMDYKIAEMYRLTDAQRATVITRGISNEIVRRMNDKAYWHFFDDKTQFNEKFARWIGRDWLKADEGLTLDISNGGVAVYLSHRFQVGEICQLTLPRIGTSPDGREQRDVVGVVCWEREAPKGSPFRMLCGLQLRFATTGERESYIRYVDNVRRKYAM